MTVLLLTLLAPPAAACSFSCDGDPEISPRDGAEVPRDTQIVSLMTDWSSEEPAILLDADGIEVKGALWLDEDADVTAWVFQPDGLLDAGETYSLAYGRDFTSTHSFTVTDGMADAPDPPVVIEEASSTVMVPSCPVVNVVAARFERPDDSAWFEVEASANRRFDDSVIYRTVGPWVGMGKPLCAPDVPHLNRGEVLHYRARAIGYDGSASDWTEDRRRSDYSCFGSVIAAFVLFVPLRLRRRLRSAAD